MKSPARSTQRILECSDRLGHEEARAIANRNWDHLSGLIERELALITQLAKQPDRTTPAVFNRAQALGQRLGHMNEQIKGQRQSMDNELKELGATRQRSLAVQAVYSQA